MFVFGLVVLGCAWPMLPETSVEDGFSRLLVICLKIYNKGPLMLREFENEKHLLRNTRKLTLFCNLLAYIDLCGFHNFGFEFSFDLCCV